MPMPFRMRPAAIIVLAAALSAAEPQLDPARLKMIPQRMQEFVDRGEISGIVTLVGRNNQIVALDAVGYADIENRKPMRTDTIVQIMSQTKTITGVAAMILVDEGNSTSRARSKSTCRSSRASRWPRRNPTAA